MKTFTRQAARRWLRLALLAAFCAALPCAAGEHPHSQHHIDLLVGHSFSRHDARERIEQLLEYWRERFGVQDEWDGDRVWLSGRVWGVDFQAWLEVSDSVVRCEATDPGGLFRNSAVDYVRGKLRKYLNPRYEEK